MDIRARMDQSWHRDILKIGILSCSKIKLGFASHFSVA